MSLLNSLIGPIASIIDKIIPDKEAQARAKLELLALQGNQEMKMIEAQLQAIVAEANSSDPWCRATVRVRERDNQDENPVWGSGAGRSP